MSEVCPVQCIQLSEVCTVYNCQRSALYTTVGGLHCIQLSEVSTLCVWFSGCLLTSSNCLFISSACLLASFGCSSYGWLIVAYFSFLPLPVPQASWAVPLLAGRLLIQPYLPVSLLFSPISLSHSLITQHSSKTLGHWLETQLFSSAWLRQYPALYLAQTYFYGDRVKSPSVLNLPRELSIHVKYIWTIISQKNGKFMS